MRMIVASSGNAASPARTESTRCAPTGELTDSLPPDQLELSARAAPPRARRQERAAEALARGFGEAALDAGHRTDLAAQAHLSKEERVGRHRTIVDRGDEGGKDGEVGRRLYEAHAAGNVDEDVQAAKRQAAAALEHGQQQGEAAVIQSGVHALR